MQPHDSVLLFTGHLLDSASRSEQRFTHDTLEMARTLIGVYIDESLRTQTYTLAVSSLGAGGDMLFAEEVLKRKIPLVVFLPFGKEQFISASVIYLKGIPNENPDEWRQKFEDLLSQANEVIYTSQIKTDSDTHAFAKCNTAMLQFALARAGHNESGVSAIALLKPDEKAVPGGAMDFVSEIKKATVNVQIVWPDSALTTLDQMVNIESYIPVFGTLDAHATHYQNRWRKRLKVTLAVLATIAFFDAFVTVPDYFLFGNGQLVRMVSLLFSVAGAFLTIQLQISDKTSLSQWTKSRAKAEQIRSELWFYLFNHWSENNRSGTYSETEFEAYMRRIAPLAIQEEVLTMFKLVQLKQKIVQLSVVDKIHCYQQYRLSDQLTYFKKKKEYFSSRIRSYKLITLGFLLVSITWGICKMLGEFYAAFSFFMDVSPLGMMISFIALVASYSEANNSKEMEYKYEQMGEGLAQLMHRSTSLANHASFDAWVKECETFLRTQNNEWSLKRDVQ
jgi:hypothetical protein